MMKLIQLNAWGGRLEYSLKQFLRSESPDILCLQEAIELEKDRGALFASVGEMCEILEAEHYYMSPAYSFNYMHRKAHFGNCIISRFPLHNQETVFTGKEYEADFDWTKHTQNIRNLQYVQIQLPSGEPLHLFNHHGHHNHLHKNGDEETIRQCGIIVDKVKSLSGKRILTGDFNLVPDSQSLKPINELLRNLTIESNVKSTRTPLTNQTNVCDYIFTSSDIEVNSFRVSDALVSDHKALILQFN